MMAKLYIDDVPTRFEYEDGSIEGVRNDHKNGIQRVFLFGFDKAGRYCRVGSIGLPLGMFTNGGTCKMNDKEYKIRYESIYQQENGNRTKD